jgi:hypothetical protein
MTGHADEVARGVLDSGAVTGGLPVEHARTAIPGTSR